MSNCGWDSKGIAAAVHIYYSVCPCMELYDFIHNDNCVDHKNLIGSIDFKDYVDLLDYKDFIDLTDFRDFIDC